MENEEIGIDLNEEVAETTEITVEAEKPKKSIKKKLLIAGGVVLGLILGAIALGAKNQKTIAEERLEESNTDENGEDDETKTEDEAS